MIGAECVAMSDSRLQCCVLIACQAEGVSGPMAWGGPADGTGQAQVLGHGPH